MKAIWNKNKVGTKKAPAKFSEIILTEKELEILVDVWELSWDLDESIYETSVSDAEFGEYIPILRRLEKMGLVVSEPIAVQIDRFDTRWSATFDDNVATKWEVFWEKRLDNQRKEIEQERKDGLLD